MNGSSVIDVQQLSYHYSTRVALREVSFQIQAGEVFAFLGPNGSGKTTLFRMLVGEESPNSGSLRVGDTVSLGYVDQSRETLTSDVTVWQEVSEGKADAYPRYAPTMEWDTAAGHAICKFAGCELNDIDTNKEILYNRKNLTNNWFTVNAKKLEVGYS